MAQIIYNQRLYLVFSSAGAALRTTRACSFCHFGRFRWEHRRLNNTTRIVTASTRHRYDIDTAHRHGINTACIYTIIHVFCYLGTHGGGLEGDARHWQQQKVALRQRQRTREKEEKAEADEGTGQGPWYAQRDARSRRQRQASHESSPPLSQRDRVQKKKSVHSWAQPCDASRGSLQTNLPS